MSDTIYALSSGRPPAAIAVVRVSGPAAGDALLRMTGTLPRPRVASLRTLRGHDGEILDRALSLYFPGPATATGEDLVELHLHGGRAIVAAVEHTLSRFPGLRLAEPGEFTRRALQNGRLDLLQAEGLADLLEAETETQRRVAIAAAEGHVSQLTQSWLDRASAIGARVEAEVDFGDEDDVASQAGYDPTVDAAALASDLEAVLNRPSVERLRDGVTVTLAGPRNAGKSSLFNALLEREAAIVTPIAGTTRDVLEASITRRGVPYRLIDTAGLTEHTDDDVERIGIAKARSIVDRADIVLWLGDAALAPPGSLRVASQCDLRSPDDDCDLATSVHQPETIVHLWDLIDHRARDIVTIAEPVTLHDRQRQRLRSALNELQSLDGTVDPLLQAEHLRVATQHLAALLGRDATEVMLDALFSRFCLGK